ncbi:PilX N-terminal domain-containing pilus assembly protein [Clostridium estertheticum]|uniref:Type 4 fimbrial biogenesis protein PilX N-terminal domain-containing protein n=1 Tax=Clostridium estertheticum TaxID=238834 RepID=A0A7Y3WSG5_9CLOT|nr:PilX N-terminal domain-containing pilus assembly protein [Clostridium estertheticum]NNU75973.1 hypothetical protein [Clostridium estertheticum]WBL46648.1 hypothetical protein LOR37_18590 [Clostridium estertheticum]
MRRKLFISKTNYGHKGSALLVVLLVMVVVSLLGMTLLTVTASNFKMTGKERDNQAVYYIAEAGCNYKVNDIKTKIMDIYNSTSTSDDFYRQLEIYFALPTPLKSFEITFGKYPEASISVSKLESISAQQRKYIISSKGTIGKWTRTVKAEMLIEWIPKNNSLPEAFIYGNKFKFAGGSVSGSGATIIVNGDLIAADFNGGSYNGISNIYINGSLSLNGSTVIGSSTQPGDIYINGDLNLDGGAKLYGNIHIAGNLNINNGSINSGKVYVQGIGNLKNGTIPGDINIAGDTSIKDATLNGNIYVGGKLTLDNTPSGTFVVNYIGSLTRPQNYSASILSMCKQVSAIPSIKTFVIPSYTISLKDNIWYANNGYTIGGDFNSDITPYTKILVDNYTSPGWQDAIPGRVVIVSKSDITIGNKVSLTGVLVAPNGTVKFDGASFSGVVISKYGFFFTSGGSTLTAMKLSDFYNNSLDMPFEMSGLSGGGDSSTITYKDLIKNVTATKEN